MRCEKARKRYPDPRAERHVASCAACRDWLALVERGRSVAAESFAPVPAGLGSRIVAVVQAEPATDRRVVAGLPVRAPRSPVLPRLLAAAAAVVLVAGAVSAWVVGTSNEPATALASAAEQTSSRNSARFTFEGSFDVDLDLPRAVEQQVEEATESAFEFPDLIPGDLASVLEQAREQTRELQERLERLLNRALRRLRRGFPFFPAREVALTMSGEGAFVGPDRVQMTGEVAVDAPVERTGSFELIRIGNDVYVRSEGAGWRALRNRLPAQVFRPVGLGLGRLAGWLEEDSPLAESLGTETLEEVETERFRLAAPPRRFGLRFHQVTNQVDVWVGVDDELVHRILIVHRLDRPMVSINGSMDIRLFDHGADIDIEPPEDAVPADHAGLPVEISIRLEDVDLWFGADLPGPRD